MNSISSQGPIEPSVMNNANNNLQTFCEVLFNETVLKLLRRYEFVGSIGSGAQGLVICCKDLLTNQRVAIKRLTRPFANVIHAKRAYREFEIMNLVNHRNVSFRSVFYSVFGRSFAMSDHQTVERVHSPIVVGRMKIKMISRHPDEYQRETKHDLFKVPRNYAAPPDPFQQQVEYSRALNAAKLERVFAKPFLAAFDGHNEAVNLLVKHPTRLSTVLSGARDGQVRVWHLTTRRCLHTLQAHSGPINGLSVDASDGLHFVTVGQDVQLKVWPLPIDFDGTAHAIQPVHSLSLDGVPHGCSHVAKSSDFVTCGEGISVWRLHRSSPIRHYAVGPNTVQHINCNPIEDGIMAGCAADRSIFLFDTRQKVPLSRVVLKLRTNSIAWHPLEPFTFVAANEDYNLYTFDMRRLDSARHVHQGHTSAVMDVDFAPSGHEFVSGSFDRSLRIFPVEQWRSREVYHTPRMQYVLSVLWSSDNKFVLSGSDDMNIRLWKANAAEKLGPLCPREKAALEYSQKLRETFQGHPEVRRIVKHRHVPKSIYSAAREHRIIRESQRRKDKNRRKNTKSAAAEPFVSERAKAIVSEGME